MNHFFSFEATEENNTSIAIKNNINLSELDSVIGMNQASFLIIDTSFKLALTERPEATDFINSGYPVNGGERCKSIDRVFELINEIHNLKKKPEQIIAMGGGSLIDLCGYLVLTSMPDCRFTVIPTTPLSQLTGFYKRKFFLNYDRKKDRLFVRGLPDYNLILPDLLRVFQMDDLREAHLVAFSVAIGYDSRFFYLVKRSLDSMVKDKVNWDYLTEMIWESNFLRAKATQNLKGKFPGETFADFLQTATYLNLDYIKALSLGLRIEVFISRKLGYLCRETYEEIDHYLKKLITMKRYDFDFQTLVSTVKEEGMVYLPILKSFGATENTRLKPGHVEDLLKEFISEK